MSGDRFSVQQTAAAVGVILSLVFVGYEIRQNTRVARATAVQATVEQIIQWQTESGTDPEWIRVYDFVRNGGAYADLSSLDQSRYSWVVISTVRITENRFRQMQMGIINGKDLDIGGGTSNRQWFQSEHFLDWWRGSDRTQSWAPDFLEFFETDVLGLR